MVNHVNSFKNQQDLFKVKLSDSFIGEREKKAEQCDCLILLKTFLNPNSDMRDKL